MNTSKIIELRESPVVRGSGCCINLRPSALSEEAAKEQARIFAALGDPTRLGILALLSAQTEPLCVCEIVTAFPLGQSTISHHLKLLRDAGLLLSVKRGLWVYYAPNRERLDYVAALVQAIGPQDEGR